MFPKKFANLISMLIMIFVMTFVVVFVSTIVNFGISSDFVLRWMKGWGIAFVVALPTVLLIMPFIKKIVEKKLVK